MTDRSRDDINRDLAEAARELQRIMRALRTLEDAGATRGSARYRALRDELPIALQRHDVLVGELARLTPSAKGT